MYILLPLLSFHVYGQHMNERELRDVLHEGEGMRVTCESSDRIWTSVLVSQVHILAHSVHEELLQLSSGTSLIANCTHFSLHILPPSSLHQHVLLSPSTSSSSLHQHVPQTTSISLSSSTVENQESNINHGKHVANHTETGSSEQHRENLKK